MGGGRARSALLKYFTACSF